MSFQGLTFALVAVAGIGAALYALFSGVGNNPNQAHGYGGSARTDNTNHEYIFRPTNRPNSNDSRRRRRRNNEEDSSETCSICLEPLELGSLVITQCGHRFHLPCLYKNAQQAGKSMKCPLCRADVNDFQ